MKGAEDAGKVKGVSDCAQLTLEEESEDLTKLRAR